MVLCPVLMVVEFWQNELGHLAIGDSDRRLVWLRHLVAVSVILGWVVLICRMPLWIYISALVYPGLALTQVRAFGEHRWALDPAHRTAIVEAPVFGLVFLHNNLHALHHASPHLPWYRLPPVYRLTRDDLVRRNGGFVYRGYGDVALSCTRFLWTRHSSNQEPRGAEGWTKRSKERMWLLGLWAARASSARPRCPQPGMRERSPPWRPALSLAAARRSGPSAARQLVMGYSMRG